MANRSGTDRNFDIVVFGATGVTGQLVSRELDKIDTIKGTWAVAGRNEEKIRSRLKEVGITASTDPEGAEVPILLADSSDNESLGRLAQSTRVIISLVGPYSRLGEPLVKACVEHGTHYCDLTGETHFVAKMIEKYHAAAQKSGATIIHACGFDSVPGDIGVMLAVHELHRKGVRSVGTVESAYDARGQLSGGTVDSLLTMLEAPNEDRRKALDPYALSPLKAGRRVWPTLVSSTSVQGKRQWGGFFVMGPFNSAIVRRSWGLKEEMDDEDIKYGPSFSYNERMVTPDPVSAFMLSIFCFFFISLLATVSPARTLLRRFGPQSGVGFGDDTLEKGWMKVTTTARSVDAKTCVTVITRAKGDPGYLITARMISSCALCLVLDADKLPEIGKKGGILTPSTALGDCLVQRLEQVAAFQFEVVSDKKE